jgi:protein O-GlcNAc transferase
MSMLDDYLNMGLAHLQSGQLGDAEQAFRAILNQEPLHAPAMLYLGIVVSSMGRHGEAIDWMTRASYLNPHPGFLLNLAQAYRQAGQMREAVATYERALQLDPTLPDAHEAFATLLLKQKRPADAVARLREALRLNPHRASAHNLLGSALCEMHQYEEGIASFREALKLQPNFAEARYNLGVAYGDVGKLDDAFASLDRAANDFPYGGHKLKAAFFLPDIMLSEAAIQKTRTRLTQQLEQLLKTDFVIREPEPERTLDWLPFFLAYHGENDRDVQVRLANLFQRKLPALSFTAPHCQQFRAARERIKVGFISRHFHNHTISKLFAGLVVKLSRPRFEVVVFRYPGFEQEHFSELLRQHADQTVTLAEDVVAAQQQVAAHELDILFYPDIGMFLPTYFLAFARLAPVQCVSWGHPVTTGIGTIDYFLSSEHLEPADAAKHYSERLVKLPHLTNYYYRPRLQGTPRSRGDLGLPLDKHIYLCPQSLFKLHPRFDPIMAGILRGDAAGAILFLEGTEPHWQQLLTRRWRDAMPDVCGRIYFAPRIAPEHFLHVLDAADVMLDPTHFGGGNTSYEGFAVGIPIVTLAGPYLRSRITYAMYRAMGIDDGIATDEADYVRRAVKLGTDTGYRQTLRDKILARNSVLYENAEAVREFERFCIDAVSRRGETRP